MKQDNFEPDQPVEFWFKEELPLEYQDSLGSGIPRYAKGNFVRVAAGGMYIVRFEHSDIEVSTLPIAVRAL